MYRKISRWYLLAKRLKTTGLNESQIYQNESNLLNVLHIDSIETITINSKTFNYILKNSPLENTKFPP